MVVMCLLSLIRSPLPAVPCNASPRYRLEQSVYDKLRGKLGVCIYGLLSLSSNKVANESSKVRSLVFGDVEIGLDWLS